jgi:hypothetical protein
VPCPAALLPGLSVIGPIMSHPRSIRVYPARSQLASELLLTDATGPSERPRARIRSARRVSCADLVESRACGQVCAARGLLRLSGGAYAEPAAPRLVRERRNSATR